jgi:hypothetical protein
LEVDAFGFHGSYRLSKSRKWAIAWRDSDPAAGVGGHGDAGLGEYVLAELGAGTVASHGWMARPNNGSVADNGSFSLADWHFGSSLSGTFSVFDGNGISIVTKELSANILASGVSRSGKLAFCATANSPSADGNKIYLFDLDAKTELFCASPKVGWADRYEFDENRGFLIAEVTGVGKFTYDRNGVLIDGAEVETAYLHSSQYDRVIRAAENILKEPDLPDSRVREVLNVVRRARSLGADANSAWKPNALKVQGLAHEQLGEYLEAAAVYEKALALNPKIGVKRRMEAISRRSSVSGAE